MSQQNNFGEALTFYADRHPDPLKRTAMNVQYTSSRLSLQTLSIEMTTINSPGESPDWANKTIIQLTKSELTGLCGVLFGLKSEVKASFFYFTQIVGRVASHTFGYLSNITSK